MRKFCAHLMGIATALALCTSAPEARAQSSDECWVLEVYAHEAFSEFMFGLGTGSAHFVQRWVNVCYPAEEIHSLEGYLAMYDNTGKSLDYDSDGQPYSSPYQLVYQSGRYTDEAKNAAVDAYLYVISTNTPYPVGQSNLGMERTCQALGGNCSAEGLAATIGLQADGWDNPDTIHTGNAFLDWTLNAPIAIAVSLWNAGEELIERIGNGIAAAWNWFANLFRDDEPAPEPPPPACDPYSDPSCPGYADHCNPYWQPECPGYELYCDPYNDPNCPGYYEQNCDPWWDPMCPGYEYYCDIYSDPNCPGYWEQYCDPYYDPNCPGYYNYCDPSWDPNCPGYYEAHCQYGVDAECPHPLARCEWDPYWSEACATYYSPYPDMLTLYCAYYGICDPYELCYSYGVCGYYGWGW